MISGRFAPRAQRELRLAAAWIAEDDPAAADALLQAALRAAERAEVRYGVEHPELGRRWLLTRVEPATLASGKRTTSVVTLDITEQHETQQRTEQLLHELGTILESTTTGIAYLRGDVLVRCNRRFMAMLGVADGSVVGRTLEELFAGTDLTGRIVTDAWQALTEGTIYETEFDVPTGAADTDPAGGRRWYSLSVRRTGPAARAGVRPGDQIVSVNGRGVDSSRAVIKTVALIPPGNAVRLSLRRGGRDMDVSVTVGRRPGGPGGSGSPG